MSRPQAYTPPLLFLACGAVSSPTKTPKTIMIITRRAVIVALPPAYLRPKFSSAETMQACKRERERERERERTRREREREREREKQKKETKPNQQKKSHDKKIEVDDLGVREVKEVRVAERDRVRVEGLRTQGEMQTAQWFAFPQHLRQRKTAPKKQKQTTCI